MATDWRIPLTCARVRLNRDGSYLASVGLHEKRHESLTEAVAFIRTVTGHEYGAVEFVDEFCQQLSEVEIAKERIACTPVMEV